MASPSSEAVSVEPCHDLPSSTQSMLNDATGRQAPGSTGKLRLVQALRYPGQPPTTSKGQFAPAAHHVKGCSGAGQMPRGAVANCLSGSFFLAPATSSHSLAKCYLTNYRLHRRAILKAECHRFSARSGSPSFQQPQLERNLCLGGLTQAHCAVPRLWLA